MIIRNLQRKGAQYRKEKEENKTVQCALSEEDEAESKTSDGRRHTKHSKDKGAKKKGRK